MNAAAWFARSSFHQSRDARPAEPARTYVDTRPRVKYAYPDGRVATIVVDHGEVPQPMISLAVSQSDPLWSTAQRVRGSDVRIVWLTLAIGL